MKDGQDTGVVFGVPAVVIRCWIRGGLVPGRQFRILAGIAQHEKVLDCQRPQDRDRGVLVRLALICRHVDNILGPKHRAVLCEIKGESGESGVLLKDMQAFGN